MTQRPLPHANPDYSQFNEYFMELAWLLIAKAELFGLHASIGDHAGCEYDIRGLIAIVRSAAGSMKDLKDLKAQKEIANEFT